MASLPAYDDYQSSFHEAFRRELHRLLDALPVAADGRVIDVPCGNGFYSRRLAERLGAGARLHAVDASEEYLTLTRAALAEVPTGAEVEVRRADAYHLPYPDASFDLVWCAQSLISLDVVTAVREFRRLVAPGGRWRSWKWTSSTTSSCRGRWSWRRCCRRRSWPRASDGTATERNCPPRDGCGRSSSAAASARCGG